MSRLLTLFLVLHWAVAFSLLAGLVLMSGDDGLAAGLRAHAYVEGGALFDSAIVTGAIGFGSAICALLFWWAFLSLLSSESLGAPEDDVVKLAYVGACGLVTAILVIGSLEGAHGLYAAIAAHLAALVASYLVIRTELSAPRYLIASNDHRVAVRAIAMDASHAARVQKFVKSKDVKRSFDR
jgi:hypothetical protein